MIPEPTDRATLRELGKAAIRAQVALRAMVVLDERGFDQTTVEEIAAATGISPRTFFRYFPTKEDVVISDLLAMGRLIEDALRERPDGEAPWAALRASMAPLISIADADPDNVLRSSRVGLSIASLRARTIERHTEWSKLLAPVLAARLADSRNHTTLAAEALSQSALACLYVATTAWVACNGQVPYGDLIDEAFEAVGTL